MFLILVVAGIGTWLYVNYFKPKTATWQSLSPGVEWRKVQIESAGFLNSNVEVVVLRLDPSRLHVETGKSKTAEEWRQSTDSIAAVNGGFFDENNHSLGLRESEGKELSRLRHVNWGVFFVQDGKAHIMHTRDFRNVDQTTVSEAIQCGPRLVVDGHPTDLKEQWARRTGIGITATGKVLIAVCDNELPLRQWARFWAAKSGLHCQQALNFDGGGSSQLSLKSDNSSHQIDGVWPVPDAVVIR
ncbi:MAG: phosphodiester glycosidase family protein [Abditibacteriaceae bacterium]